MPKTKRTLTEREALVNSVVPESIGIGTKNTWSPEYRDAMFTWSSANGTPMLAHLASELLAKHIGFTGKLWKSGDKPPTKGRAANYKFITDARMRNHILNIAPEWVTALSEDVDALMLNMPFYKLIRSEKGDVNVKDNQPFADYLKANPLAPAKTRGPNKPKDGPMTVTVGNETKAA